MSHKSHRPALVSSSSRMKRRSYSSSPTRTALSRDEDLGVPVSSSSTVKPIRRGRKPTNQPPSKHHSVTTTPDELHGSFNSSLTSLEHSMSELDFLGKSPVGHQWRNKKHWQTNANAMQRRFQEISGKSYTMTPQGMERELRRNDIRASLMASMEDLNVPDL